MRKTKSNRKHTNLRKSRDKLYSKKKKGRGIGASKCIGSVSGCMPRVTTTTSVTDYNRRGEVRFDMTFALVYAKDEYEQRLKLALKLNEYMLDLQTKGIKKLIESISREEKKEDKPLPTDSRLAELEEEEEEPLPTDRRLAELEEDKKYLAELEEDKKYTQFAINHNTMLLNKMASQPSIDYFKFIADLTENPDWDMGKMAPTRSRWQHDAV
jgi:hypothetical protein